jgi:hypothetical protein
MNAFDTDVLTEILLGQADFVARASAIPASQQAVPIIVIEEILRGRLNVIRQAKLANRASALTALTNCLRRRSETFDGFNPFHTLLPRKRSTNNGDNRASAFPRTICVLPPFA